MNVRISKEDVKHFGREDTAVALPDGSGYIGTLNVFHEIHCIRWLHNTLRKFALCHGDVGLITYSWNPHHEKPSANATAHQCVDWDALSQWAEERAVDMFKPGFLVHPTLGPAYPDGEPIRGGPHEEEHTLPPIPSSILEGH
ncbi:hypothetical protein F4677DRAFT_442974 [Hypoxylon crocopeplum]|nr:hypothetical protein F4677DRAFT_442974 [Hypoxylon crocopeplum]